MGSSAARRELALIGITLLWAGTFLLIKRALPYCDPIAFVTLRFSVATVAAVLLWRSSLGQLWNRNVWRHGVILGVGYAIGFYLQAWGLQYTTIARSAFFTGTFVVFVPLLQRLIWRKHPTAREWWGMVLGTAGIGLLASPEAGSLNIGDIATLVSALAWSFYMGYMSYAGIEQLGTIGTGMLVVLQCGVTAAIGGVVFAIRGAQASTVVPIAWNVDVIIALLYTSILASVVATYMQTRVQPGVSAARVALIFALEPVFATFLGMLAQGERLRNAEVLGAVLIIVAAILPSLTLIRQSRQ
ncbi:MAG: DMT family transporter [Chlorobi bacterium]|nr:DMT family transporter [Chlorobiota bacterium]